MYDHYITIENISQSYFGGYVGISNASLSIDEGCLLCIVGSHNSGKSSLMKAIAGIEKYDGKIIYKGEDLANITLHDRNFSLTFGEESLKKRRTVAQNLAYPLIIRKCFTKEQINIRVADIAEAWGLSACLKMQVARLDNITAASVVLARAFMHKRDLYLLDSPMRNLHGAQREELLCLLSAAIRKSKSTVIYTTDRLAEATALSPDCYAIIENGILMNSGSLREIFRNPSSLSVAKAVSDGEINILDIAIKNRTAILLGNQISVGEIISSDVFTSAIMAIYPRDIRVCKYGKYRGKILEISRYIYDSRLVVSTSDSTVEMYCDIDDIHRIEDNVNFDIDLSKVMLFDRMSELNISK